MSAQMTTYPLVFQAGAGSRGVSEIARYIADQESAGKQRLQNTYSLGLKAGQVFSELNALAAECAVANWDSYGAEPIQFRTIQMTWRFLTELPIGTSAPSLGAEPDGHITLEWHGSPHHTLSISISPNGELHYAAILGLSKQFGTEPFLDGLPPTILDLINRAEAHYRVGAA